MAPEYNTSSRESEDQYSPRLSGRRQNNANLSYRKSRLLWSMDGVVCVIVWSRFANGLLDDVTMKLTFHTAIVPVLRCQAAWVTAPCFDHMIKLKKKNCLGFWGFHGCLWVIYYENRLFFRGKELSHPWYVHLSQNASVFAIFIKYTYIWYTDVQQKQTCQVF